MIDTGLLQQLHWREPLWLLLGLQPIILWAWQYHRHQKRLAAYADPSLQDWVILERQTKLPKSLLSRQTAYFLAWLLFAVAAAGPRVPIKNPRSINPNAINIMVIVDISRSMQANDIQPSRLRRAALALDELVTRTQGQRLGVIVFAARAHVYVPLTSDSHALRYYLRSLEKLTLPTRGSQLDSALLLAKHELDKDIRPGAIVLISDGDIADGDLVQHKRLQIIAQQLKQQHQPLYILGIGSSEGGPIPLATGGWLSVKDKPVISRMDESLLQQLAGSSGGRYSRLSDDDADWRRLYDNGLLKQFPHATQNPEQEWHELLAWVLFPGLILFFIALVPSTFRPLFSNKVAQLIVMVVICAGILGTLNKAEAADNQQWRAQQAFAQGHYDEAVKHYEHVSGYAGLFGAGAAFYRKGDYKSAQKRFAAAILQADSDQQRAASLFNLGNVYFQQGNYQSAIQSFADVLRYEANFSAAQNNLAFSRALYLRVTAELSKDEQGSNAGSGPRMNPMPESVELQQNMAASLSNDKMMSPRQIPPLPDNKITRTLIDKGLRYLRLAAETKSNGPTIQQQQSLAEARVFKLQIEDRPALLWQRLFETEEGFDAPQSQPNVIPGVQPW